MHRNKSVSTHQFTMIPKAEIPRSKFKTQSTHKTTFDAGNLVPIYVDEVLPGDTYNCRATMFARMATPLYPTMDNLTMETFFFFVPARLVWDNWQKFNGEQTNPGDHTDYLVPQVVSPAGGYAVGSMQDYMGLPTVGQMDSDKTISTNALPMRCYNLIYNEWFRDENLQNSVKVDKDDGPDSPTDYVMLKRGKRKDYFTSALPWPQKGDSVSLPLGTTAPIKGDGLSPIFKGIITENPASFNYSTTQGYYPATGSLTPNEAMVFSDTTGLYADLSQATAATINQLRQSFQIQRLLERDARGGTRYTEILRAHWGVTAPDFRLQRPEYLGGGSTPININPIAQTSATGQTGATTPLGQLGAMATTLAHGHGFSQSFVEHGYVIGLVEVRADLTYQQGLARMWSRKTRFDFYWPVFAHLGEQAILNKEIYVTGDPVKDDAVFGYQERWAEYRYAPSRISSLFRSTAAGTLDGWHLAQKFTAPPVLGSDFIVDNPPMDRVLAVGSNANGQQFIFDAFFDVAKARPMPLYSVPGMIDHF